MSYKKLLYFHSSLAFTLAGMVAITLHELSHLFAGKLLGLHATLYSNAVEYTGVIEKSDHIITAATGPLFSLVLGIIILLTTSNLGKGTWRLFWMWLGLMSTQIGVGYFLIAPFTQVGDTGAVLSSLDAPKFVYYIAFAIGVVGTLILSRIFAKKVTLYTDRSIAMMRPFGIFSWLTGTMALLIIYIFSVRNLSDSEQFVTLFGVIAAGIFAPMFSFFWRKTPKMSQEVLVFSSFYPISAAIGAFACFLIFVLANGISF